jgi:hypothetical protein
MLRRLRLKTAAFWEIVAASRAPEDAEMLDAIDVLGAPNPLTLPQLIALADADFALFLRDRKNAKRIPYRLEACGYVAVRNDTTADGRWKGRRQKPDHLRQSHVAASRSHRRGPHTGGLTPQSAKSLMSVISHTPFSRALCGGR